jgi:hypothetical protein
MTENEWKTLANKDKRMLADYELAQLHRSARGGANLYHSVIEEMKRRGLMIANRYGRLKEINKNLKDYYGYEDFEVEEEMEWDFECLDGTMRMKRRVEIGLSILEATEMGHYELAEHLSGSGDWLKGE